MLSEQMTVNSFDDNTIRILAAGPSTQSITDATNLARLQSGNMRLHLAEEETEDLRGEVDLPRVPQPTGGGTWTLAWSL